MDTILTYIRQITENALHYINDNYPYLLIGFGILLVFFIWRKARAGRRGDFRKYKGIDSDTLDANPDILNKFYKDAFLYRSRYGSKKYQQNVVAQFRFFYNFHNSALCWIDEIVTRCKSSIPSTDFILTTIRSGQIGKIFSEIKYAGGIPGTDIRPGTPLIACARADAIELWSPLKDSPICALSKSKLDLQRANKDKGTITGILCAESRNTGHPMRIKLQFPEFIYDTDKNQLRQHDIYATQNYQQFKTWIDKNVRLNSSQTTNFNNTIDYGIEVDYGIPAPELLDKSNERLISLAFRLKALEGRIIDACFQSRLRHASSSVATEFYIAMCSGLGLVVILENKSTGKILYNGDAGWMVYENNRSQIIANPCLQARRIEKHLAQRLSTNNLHGWPLHCLVVFTANTVSLKKTSGKQSVQCEAIRLQDLETWLSSNSKQNTLRFTKDDFNHFALLLNSKQGKYNHHYESIA